MRSRPIRGLTLAVIVVGAFLAVLGASSQLCYPCGGFYGAGTAFCQEHPDGIISCSPSQSFVLPFQSQGYMCTIACVLRYDYTLNLVGVFLLALGLALFLLARRSPHVNESKVGTGPPITAMTAQ